MESAEIFIFGKKYRIKGEDSDKIRKFSEWLNSHLDEVNENVETFDIHTIFSLASMNMAEKYFSLLDENILLKKEIERLNSLFSGVLSSE